MTSVEMQKRLRAVLAGLGVASAAMVTLKTFRASSATHLAKQGHGIGVILQAGEWKSSAYLRYTSQQVLDEVAFLEMAIDRSEEETEEGA